MARADSKARQAAFEELVQAAGALAVRHRTDQAQRGEATPEYFNHPGLGRQENCLMVSVPLLNRLARASSQFAQVMAAPASKPARTLPTAPLAADGHDC